jgi:hypothetical protein
MVFDAAYGFLALRNMLAGGSFNIVSTPDPGNIANDIGTYLTWWSPGQYLVPGLFIWLGCSYGLAISLTTMIASAIGVLGWIRIALAFEVPNFTVFMFALGLVSFHYATSPFRLYTGGEVLLFAVSPWSLCALQFAVQKRPAISLSISVVTASVVFFAKLSGLVMFGTTVTAISVSEIIKRRQITSSLFALWTGSSIAAIVILTFWVARGQTPVTGAEYNFTPSAVLFPIAAAVFSGLSLHELLSWLFLYPSSPMLSSIRETSYVLGPFGLLVIWWVWNRLRNTRHRPMAIFSLTLIAIYITTFIAMYIRNGETGTVAFEERYFRYAGILFFLLLLVAIDQWHAIWGKVVATGIVAVFALYGLASYAHGTRELTRGLHFDPASGTSMLLVSPAALEYLRSEMMQHNWQNAIAVVPDPEAANGLPRFRILFSFHLLDSAPFDDIARQKWAGRTDKIFVIIDSRMRDPSKVDAVLRTFVDYDFRKWDRKKIDGMLVASQ